MIRMQSRAKPHRAKERLMMRRTLLILTLLGGIPLAPARAQAPSTPVASVIDTLYGTPVPDPYRWLEDGASAEVQAWFRSQGAHARSSLDDLPGRAAILERIRAIGEAAPPDVSLPIEAGGRWFYTIRRAGEPVPRGYVRDAWTGEERLLVNPADVGGTGEAGANRLATYSPSPDGRLVLYGITSGGSESVVLRVRDVENGSDMDGPFVRNRWDGMARWNSDGRAFFYLQLRDLPADAPPTELFLDTRVMRHRMGADPTARTSVFSAAAVGEDPRLLAFVDVDPRSGLAIGQLNSGVEMHSTGFYVASAADVTDRTPSWRRLFEFTDSVGAIAIYGADLYALTRKGAPLGRIVRTPLADPDLASAAVVLPEGSHSIEGMSSALDGLYVRVFVDGVNGMTRVPWSGAVDPIELPLGTSVEQVHADPLRVGVLLTLVSTASASRPYRYDPSTDALEPLPLRELGPGDRLEGFVTENLFVPSHDGVRVPLTITRRADGARDGSMPLLLYGYGAYSVTDPPAYRPELRPWFESGGGLARCHVRGGGYYGEAWHQAGQKATKPNTWLDFIACAEHLVREGYTRPDRLAALGMSAGGITVGRAISERPDLFAAAIIGVGILDAVRFETTPNGPPNVPEFGSVATEEGFRALLAMSAVHHVRPGTPYPAVLLTTGLNDPRVASWQPAKMAAALQVATTSGRPVLLRVDEAAGHSPAGGTDEQFRQEMADWLAFIMAATGMPPYRASSP
jgi:prolyl oligopeptidase